MTFFMDIFSVCCATTKLLISYQPFNQINFISFEMQLHFEIKTLLSTLITMNWNNHLKIFLKSWTFLPGCYYLDSFAGSSSKKRTKKPPLHSINELISRGIRCCLCWRPSCLMFFWLEATLKPAFVQPCVNSSHKKLYHKCRVSPSDCLIGFWHSNRFFSFPSWLSFICNIIFYHLL